MSPADENGGPVPRVAYDRWLDALARAGWSPRPGRPRSGRVPGGQGAELVPVADALGRVTAAPVTARWPSPRAACAAMDGIAVRAADLAAAPLAGPGGNDRAVRLPAALLKWVDTGDPMPAGADSVVIRERLLPQADGSVIITSPLGDAAGAAGPAGPKRNVRAAGEDFAAGELLVPAGRRLRPGDLAAVAAGGHATVAAVPEPVVAVIPTGDEIRPVGSVPHRGEIIDTNSLMLAARCRQLGSVPVVSAVVPDDPDSLAAEIRHAAATADLVLVIAGSSRGRDDHAAAVIAQIGGLAVAGVAVRPGHPALLGHAKRPDASHVQPTGTAGAPGQADHRTGIAPVIGLPGYPLAAAVIFELFAVPLIAALAGHPPVRQRLRARLDRDWSSPAGAEEWVLVTLAPAGESDPPLATPAKRGAGSISLLARADAWWPVPSGQDAFAAGTEIEVFAIAGTDCPRPSGEEERRLLAL